MEVNPRMSVNNTVSRRRDGRRVISLPRRLACCELLVVVLEDEAGLRTSLFEDLVRLLGDAPWPIEGGLVGLGKARVVRDLCPRIARGSFR